MKAKNKLSIKAEILQRNQGLHFPFKFSGHNFLATFIIVAISQTGKFIKNSYSMNVKQNFILYNWPKSAS